MAPVGFNPFRPPPGTGERTVEGAGTAAPASTDGTQATADSNVSGTFGRRQVEPLKMDSQTAQLAFNAMAAFSHLLQAPQDKALPEAKDLSQRSLSITETGPQEQRAGADMMTAKLSFSACAGGPKFEALAKAAGFDSSLLTERQRMQVDSLAAQIAIPLQPAALAERLLERATGLALDQVAHSRDGAGDGKALAAALAKEMRALAADALSTMVKTGETGHAAELLADAFLRSHGDIGGNRKVGAEMLRDFAMTLLDEGKVSMGREDAVTASFLQRAVDYISNNKHIASHGQH
ncbi:hypothetical protein [Telmatospirillum sp. J64-1]|uniref:hypothetical protein n=1 Tax=Telmatospirillum sp. J64-1 TaxID=2502183 RepID=UPI00115E35F1|nr:hypothetical protein [Telmatospirillum sp. J64-1]